MRVVEKVFEWKGNEFSYLEIGTGTELVMGFHGYGLTGHSFSAFAASMHTSHTFFLFDLPYHGKTRTRRSFLFDETSLTAWFHDFFAHVGATGKVHLLAYSLGGNFALSLCANASEYLATCSLMAIDGLAPKPGFKWLTRTHSGRWFFQGFIAFPQPIFWVMDFLRFVGWLPEKVHAFYMASSNTSEKRKQLYSRWRSVSGIFPKQLLVVKRSLQHGIRFCLIFSDNDKVIPYSYAKKFADKLGTNNAELITLQDGHQLMNRKIAALWASFMSR